MGILELLEYLDARIKEIEASYRPGDETGDNLSYEIIDNFTIAVNYGWTTYEESDDNDITISFGTNIIVNTNNSGHSVYGGDYDSLDTLIFNNITELISWLREEGV